MQGGALDELLVRSKLEGKRQVCVWGDVALHCIVCVRWKTFEACCGQVSPIIVVGNYVSDAEDAWRTLNEHSWDNSRHEQAKRTRNQRKKCVCACLQKLQFAPGPLPQAFASAMNSSLGVNGSALGRNLSTLSTGGSSYVFTDLDKCSLVSLAQSLVYGTMGSLVGGIGSLNSYKNCFFILLGGQ